MKRITQLGRFAARFWPLWLPLLLIFALPWSRPFGRIVSDEIVGGIMQTLSGREKTDPMPAAAAHPADFNLQLWHAWKDNENNYDYSGSFDTAYAEMRRLDKKFPGQPLLVAPPLQERMGLPSWVRPYYYFGSPIASGTQLAAELKSLRASARRGQLLEPDNAFWPVALAQVEWRANRYGASLAALERAAKCARYDDHTLDLTRRLVRARQRYGAPPPPFFEKLRIVEVLHRADPTKLSAQASSWGTHARRLRTKGDAARALRWSGALIAVGDLMQRDLNSWSTAKAGAAWQNEGYCIGVPTKNRRNALSNARIFAAFARAKGRADLAQLAPRAAARSQKVVALAGDTRNRYNQQIWLQRGQFDRWVNLLEGLPWVLAMNLFYLALWWGLANLCLWRAHAAPSARRDRVGFGFGIMGGFLLVGGGALWLVLASDNGTLTGIEGVWASLALFTFFGAPFALALICALVTLRRHRERFALPPRVDMELGLAAWTRAFLRWFLPASVVCIVTLLGASWALWIVANWRGWGQVNLLALLPPDRRGTTGTLMWDSTGPWLPCYAVALCLICLLIWFGRWRWTAPAAIRPLTQSGLRWWKESLGISLVTLSWACLLMALLSAPLLSQAEVRLQNFLNVGELDIGEPKS